MQNALELLGASVFLGFGAVNNRTTIVLGRCTPCVWGPSFYLRSRIGVTSDITEHTDSVRIRFGMADADAFRCKAACGTCGTLCVELELIRR